MPSKAAGCPERGPQVSLCQLASGEGWEGAWVSSQENKAERELLATGSV